MEGNSVYILLEMGLHLIAYAALLFLAGVCIITANSLDKYSPPIQKSILVAKLISCATLFISTYYSFAAIWILFATIPLIFGAAFGLIESLHTKNIHLIIEIKKLTRLQLFGMFIKSFHREKGKNESAEHRQ